MPYSTIELEKTESLSLGLDLPLAPVAEVSTLNLDSEISFAEFPLTIREVANSTSSKHRFNPFSKVFRQKLLKAMPWILSGTILAIDLVVHAPLFVLGAGIFSFTTLLVKAIVRRVPALQRMLKALLIKLGVKDGVLPTLSAGVAGGTWLTVSSPSNALFFQAAETYFQSTFGGSPAATTALPLVFGALRVIFVLYLAIALVRVINAFRQDEDWVTAARIPMMVVLCVVLGDVLSTLIVQ
jgi:hypothetical protein